MSINSRSEIYKWPATVIGQSDSMLSSSSVSSLAQTTESVISNQPVSDANKSSCSQAVTSFSACAMPSLSSTCVLNLRFCNSTQRVNHHETASSHARSISSFSSSMMPSSLPLVLPPATPAQPVTCVIDESMSPFVVSIMAQLIVNDMIMMRDNMNQLLQPNSGFNGFNVSRALLASLSAYNLTGARRGTEQQPAARIALNFWTALNVDIQARSQVALDNSSGATLSVGTTSEPAIKKRRF